MFVILIHRDIFLTFLPQRFRFNLRSNMFFSQIGLLTFISHPAKQFSAKKGKSVKLKRRELKTEKRRKNH